MASQRANITKASGLYTYISELSAPEGSLVIADNVNINERDVITPRRGLNDYGDSLPISTDRVKQIMEYKQRIIRHYNSVLEFDDGSGTFTPFDGSYLEVEPGFRLKFQEINGNFYFTSSAGIKKISARNASGFTGDSGYITNAGAPKAVDVAGTTIPASGGFLPPESKVAYKILWGYRDKNNVLILGSPSARSVITNTSRDITTSEVTLINFENPANGSRYLGKYFGFNSSDNSYYVWYNDSAGGYDEPVNSDTLGATGIEVIITNADTIDDLANKTANAISAAVSAFTVTVDAAEGEVLLTSTEEQDLDDPIQGSIASTDMIISTIEEGSVVEGSNVNVELSFIVPQDVTSDYFYQVYRTTNISVSEGLSLNDIDPGEDCNLVLENPVGTSVPGDIITVTDTTPNTFRDTGTPLYNNPISGQGLLQTNDRPPIAKDIENFSNYTFYSNTSTYHRLTFNILSVDDLGNLETNFYVGNEDGLSKYTFQGVKERTSIFCGTVEDTHRTYWPSGSGTVRQSIINLYSANDDTRYVIWFDKGTNVITGATTNTTNNRIEATAHGLENDDIVTVEGSTFTIAAFVINANPDNFQVSFDKGGSAFNVIAFGADGSSVGVEQPSLAPSIDGAVNVRVNLSSAAVSPTDNVAQYLAEALELIDDFSISTTAASVVVTNENNGASTDANSGPTNVPADDLGTSWNIIVSQQGSGEEVANNYVLVSGLASVGQAIEETARSLVSVINRDSDSPVNAFYLSGSNDLPGKILLESKSLEDKPFYLGVNSTAPIGDDIGAEFNPVLPIVSDITSITNSGTETTFTSASHGAVVGSELYISAPNNDPAIDGLYTVTSADTNTFTIELITITPDDTDAVFFFPDQVSDNSETPNRLYYSKLGQPEAVPIANYVDVGTKDKAIERILALRDSLFILKEDGTYILSGAPPFNVRLLDNTSTIVAPDSAVILNNQIYCLNEDGVVTINETGVSLISRPIENLVLNSIDNEFDYRLKVVGAAYESDKAYFLWLQESATDEAATQAYRYNVFERTWTRWTVPASAAYVSENNLLYIGDGTRNYLQRERKNKDRTDHSDRNFSRLIPDDAIEGKTIRLSSLVDVEVGDVLVQTQPVTVSLFNALINKLEIDPDVSKINITCDGGTDTITATAHGLLDGDKISLGGEDYFVINSTANTFQLSEIENGPVLDLSGTEITVNRVLDVLLSEAGDDMVDKLTTLISYLGQIGITVSAITPSTATLKEDFNTLIGDLNSQTSGTRYKNYREAGDPISYESIIVGIDTQNNEVEVLYTPAFLVGNIEVYKSIKTKVQWSPLHFGDPSSQKQMSKGTVIMDQNNFTEAIVSYSTDLSQGFVPVTKRGKGVGYFSSAQFGEPDLYWGGGGNDIPIMSIIPRQKQRGRYLNVKFEHSIAREDFRIVGITALVRIVSSRGYR